MSTDQSRSVALGRRLGIVVETLNMFSVRFGASRFFSSRPVLVAAAGLLPMVLAAGHAIAATPPASPRGDSAAAELTPLQLLERARQQLNTGKPVLARASATRAVSLGADHTSAAEIVARARLAIEDLSPAELSLQKAELAIEEGDLRTADRHLNAVSASPLAGSGSNAARVSALRSQWDARRSELAPIIADALAQAERDFLAKRYADARAGFQLVDRSGVSLNASQQAILDRYQLALVQLAEREPTVFGKVGSAGMMQPGVVRRRDGGSAPAQPDAQPPAAPEQPAAQPEPEPMPVPVAEPLPVPLPVAQPAGDPIALARVQEATDLLALADRAFVEKRFADALTRYERIRIDFNDVLSAEQRGLVERRISEARVMINADRLGTPEAELANRDLARQQIQAEFENDLELARRALAGGNTSDARNRVAQARLRLSAGRNLFAEATLEQLQDRATALAAEIDREEQRLAQVRAEERDRAVREQAARAQQTAREQRERKIAELVLRAREFQREKRYREALQTAEQILFLDPINPTGLLLKDIYQDVLIFEDSRSIYERKQLNRATLSMENQRAAIPALNLVDFPPDWPSISARRGEPVQFAEPAENRRVLGMLEQTRVPSVTLADNSLEDAIRFFTTISQLNVDVDWVSLEEAGIRRDTTLSLNLTNVSQKQLLDRIVEKVSGIDTASRAGWAVIDGVVTIASDRRIRRNTVLVIYDIKDLLTEIPDFRDAPRIDLQQALQASQGGGGGGGPFTDTGQNEQEQEEQRRLQRDERMTELENIIIDNIDSEGWVPRGGETGTITRLANQGSFIIRNTPANHREITGLLRKLREVRAMQINVECRFLLVNQDFFEQIGIDLDVYINANNNQVRTARGFDQSIRGGDFFDFEGAGLLRDVQGSLRRVPAQAVAPTPANPQGNTGGAAVTQGVVPPRNWSPIGFGQNSLGLSQAVVPRSANWGDLILSNAPALGIAGQFLDDIQVDFLIRATQADRRSAQLTAPRVTFTNGQASNIYVATQTAFVSDLQPVTSDSAVGFDPTVSVVTEGVTLLVEGTISADRRFVTMTVDGGVARVAGFANQAVSAVAGGQLVNSAAVQSFIQLPQITVTRVRTTVTVPDQGTLLLGGQRLVTEFEVESGVPVLSKLPILNRFFTNRIESKEEQTLLVLIKPTIMIMGEDEERNFPGLSQSLGLGGN